jgi:hypothetical protein
MGFTNVISSIVGSSRSSKTSSQGEVDRLSKDLDISESEAREILSH